MWFGSNWYVTRKRCRNVFSSGDAISCHFFFLIGGSLFYNVVVVSAIHQHESVIIIYIYIYIYIKISPLSWASLSPHSTPLSCHRVPGWVLCTIDQLPASCLFDTWWHIYVYATFSILSTLAFPHCVHQSILYLCVNSIPTKFLKILK